tara:strand:+ start:172 stop:567 length:396 start_codon:yes stop_codon:yes gene_type:complete
MSSVPDLLKEAYEKQDWSLISKMYQSLTGEDLINEELDEEGDIRIRDIDSPNHELEEEDKFSDFRVRDRDEPAEESSEMGNLAKRESMSIPEKGERELTWVDDGSIAQEDSIKKNPNWGTIPKKVKTPRND